MQIQEVSRPQVGGSWCGTSWGPSIYYSETKSITLIIRLLHLAKDQNNYNFDFRMAYKVLRKEYATVRFGGTPPAGIYFQVNLVNIRCDRFEVVLSEYLIF